MTARRVCVASAAARRGAAGRDRVCSEPRIAAVADPTTIGEQAKQNGGGEGAGRRRSLAVVGAAGACRRARPGRRRARRRGQQSLAGEAARRVGRRVAGGLTADLDDRDPDYIRENLPLSWLLATLWFRAEVRNMGNVPEEGPVLLVGNHSGGNMTPEVIVLRSPSPPTSGSSGPSTSSLTTSSSPRPSGRSCAATAPSPPLTSTPREALELGRGAARLPRRRLGGPPPAGRRNKVDFAGRKGFIRLALDADVPIVPVVTVGGQETALFLSRGGLARQADFAPTSCCG